MRGYPIRRDPCAWTGPACAAGFLLLAWFWEACTFVGGVILIPIGVLFVLAALVSGRVRLAIMVAVVLIAAALFTDVVKDLIARPRPPGEADPLITFSFPSGHTLNSTVTYGLIALVALGACLIRAAAAMERDAR